MPRIELFELIQQDIEDIKSIINYEKYGLKKDEMIKYSRGILINLQEHLEEFVED